MQRCASCGRRPMAAAVALLAVAVAAAAHCQRQHQQQQRPAPAWDSSSSRRCTEAFGGELRACQSKRCMRTPGGSGCAWCSAVSCCWGFCCCVAGLKLNTLPHALGQHWLSSPAVHPAAGHSLGGAVAQLCTLRLLHTLHPAPPPATALRCIVFGSPAIGNAALADHVHRLGWEAHFRSIVLPGGGLPLLLPCRCRCPTSQHPLAVMNVSCCMCLA